MIHSVCGQVGVSRRGRRAAQLSWVPWEIWVGFRKRRRREEKEKEKGKRGGWVSREEEGDGGYAEYHLKEKKKQVNEKMEEKKWAIHTG